MTIHIPEPIDVMIFILFLLIPVGLINVLLAVFFPYPAPFFAIGLQGIFFLLGVFLLFTRFSRKKGILRALLATGLHGMALYFAINLYVNLSLPHQEKDEAAAFSTGMGKIWNNLFQKAPEVPLQNIGDQGIRTENSKNQSENVEDPF